MKDLIKKKNIKIIIVAQIATLVFMTFLGCSESFNKKQPSQILTVSEDGHSLLKGGKPLFWLADTGWLLFTQSPGDVNTYFANRVRNEFNAIQMMVTRRMFNDSMFTPNYRGDLPFTSLDPVTLNEAYFAHIDTIVMLAEKNNLVLAMAPTWGTVLDQIFSVNAPDKAYDFGYLLGERYRKYKNVIWIVCGEYQKIAWDDEKKKPDSNPDEYELNLIENLARGLKSGNHGENLMTIHPDGWKSSSEHFHDADWLDFNMIQTYSIGTGTEFDVYNDYEKLPHKPTMLAEPGYEMGGAGHQAFEVRYEGYSSILNGGFGYTYGREGIWDFQNGWKNLLNSEGALQMKYLRDLFESRPLLDRRPAPEVIHGNPGQWKQKTKCAAAMAKDSSYMFVYFPIDTVTHQIHVGYLSGDWVRGWWFNPRNGKVYDAENQQTMKPFIHLNCEKKQEIISFNPPGKNGEGYDWVLVLDNADSGYPSIKNN